VLRQVFDDRARIRHRQEDPSASSNALLGATIAHEALKVRAIVAGELDQPRRASSHAGGVPLRRTMFKDLSNTPLAHAEEPTASSPIVPTLQISGATSGKGKASVGVDFRVHRGKWDVFLNPSFSVANASGATNIFGLTSSGASGPTQFSGSLSATFARVDRSALSVDPAERDELVAASALCLSHRGAPGSPPGFISATAIALMGTPPEARGVAYRQFVTQLNTKIAKAHPGCTFGEGDAASEHAAHCACQQPDPTCKDAELVRLASIVVADAANTCSSSDIRSPMCDFIESPSRDKLPVDPPDYCEAGRSYLNDSAILKKKKKGLRRLLYPEHLVELNATYGAGNFKYVEGTNGSLRKSTSTLSSIAGNALYTFVQPSTSARFTFELPVGFQWTWTESTKTAYQCKPSIGVLEGAAVEECKQLPLNAPIEGLQLSGSAHFGVASIAGSDLWRVAAGPTFMVDFAKGASKTYQVGGQIPLYLSLTKAAGVETEYQGMARVMLTVLAERVDGKVGPSAVLSLTLLGKRKMFGNGLFFP
jgi:hypothetical protein